jgi:hypothetical protein
LVLVWKFRYRLPAGDASGTRPECSNREKRNDVKRKKPSGWTGRLKMTAGLAAVFVATITAAMGYHASGAVPGPVGCTVVSVS